MMIVFHASLATLQDLAKGFTTSLDNNTVYPRFVWSNEVVQRMIEIKRAERGSVSADGRWTSK